MEAGIGMNESVHFVGVAGHDHNEPVATVLHALEQRFYRLLTEIFAFLGEAVGFVYKEYAVQRRVDHGVGARRGLADVLRNKSGTVALDQMPLLQNAERFIDAPNKSRHGRFT